VKKTGACGGGPERKGDAWGDPELEKMCAPFPDE
jgi:hypothetical protein